MAWYFPFSFFFPCHYSFVVTVKLVGHVSGDTKMPACREPQFQVELGGGPDGEVAGAGVPQPRVPCLCMRLGLRGLQGHRPLAGQQRGQAEDLSGG